MSDPLCDPTKAEYRKDGWPLCPQCGDDELYDPLSFDRPADPFASLKCYLCDWEGRVPERPRTDRVE